MKKEQLAEYIGKPILNPLDNLLLLSILGIISSPFLWIWISGSLALKIFLTSIISVFIISGLRKLIKKCIKEIIDEEQKVSPYKGESKFNEKLKNIMEEQSKNK